MIIFFKVVVLS